MIKFVIENVYGFGLTEANLNRMEFNHEPIFFDFGYCGNPELFGLVFYLGECKEPADITANADLVHVSCLPFLDAAHGVTVETLRVFPIAQSVMQNFRNKPFWALSAHIEITQPGDKQLFFAGRTEHEIEQYFESAGLIDSQTKRTSKGFGKSN